MKELTSKERLMRIFCGEEVDRPALKLWGMRPEQPMLHPAYRPVYERALEKTDIFWEIFMPFNTFTAPAETKIIPFDAEWQDEITTIHTPEGDLTSTYRRSLIGAPGYDMEYFFKEEEDIKKFLALPVEESTQVDTSGYFEAQRKLGDRGIVHINVNHAGFMFQQMCGSENLAFFSVDCRELVQETIARFSKLRYNYVKKILQTGIKPVMSWYGPEVFIPPLMSPNDFEEFVFQYDKPLCDLIHEYGGYTWMHSHGKTANFIERYIDMGIDVVNPLEPAPNGDIYLKKTALDFRGRIGLEGNIEIQELINSPEERVRQLIKDCVDFGKESGRFILCPSAGYMEYVDPGPRYISNLLTFIEYGHECVKKCKK